ncbi:MAG TPA: endonuclease/exonuclease/phosphatase family protein [Gemmatimonadaceae bacterium]|nr:endonuclease/exonuclease/phosphatase family protein [Gemmatimonadaceae bacterium]
MPTFTVHCECGETFHADERSLGRRVRCRRCQRVVALDPPAPAAAEPPPSDRGARGERVRTRRRVRVPRRPKADATPAGGAGGGAAGGRIVAVGRRQPRGARGLAARAVRWLSWGYLAAVCLVALLMWGLGDVWWPATVLLFMGRWVFLLPLALLVPAALVLRRASLGPLLLAALVTLGPVMGFRTGWRRWLGEPAGAPVRVVTFNAEGGATVAPMLPELLVGWEADVVAFQECSDPLIRAARAVRGWYEHDTSGLCLLSRFPIRDTVVMDRSALATIRRSHPAVGGAGYVVRYTLQTPWGAVDVTNLHLETPRKGFEALMATDDATRLRLNTEERDVESTLASRFVRAGDAPRLVLGDFNTPVESRIFRRHWGGLTDAFSRVGTGFGMTKYNGWIRVRIDHVLYDDAWRATRAVAGPDLGSDHRPLIVDLRLTRRSGPPE